MSSLPAGRELERSAKRARRNDSEEAVPPPPRSSDPFSNLPPDALTIVLKYARPSDDIHRFEFAWSVGKISKTLREHRIADVLPVVPFHLEEYEEYTPLNGTDDREPFDCRAALIKALVTDPTKCALISELHITRQSIEKHDYRINSGMVTSLRSLLTKEGAFKNAQSLSINLAYQGVYGYFGSNIPLLNKAVLKKMPESFPATSNVTLGHCFSPEILLSVNLFTAFFQSFQTPLRSIALVSIPGLTQYHAANVLSAIGDNLTRLEIDGGQSGCNKTLSVFNVPGTGNDEMVNALITNCKRLESLSLCGLSIDPVYMHHHLSRFLSSITGLKELVLKRNVHSILTEIVGGGYREIYGSEAEQHIAGLFLEYGDQLESFHCDFSDMDVGSDALDNLVDLQLRALSDAENAAVDGAPKTIKLQKVGMGLLHTASIAKAIHAGVREFEMSEESMAQAENSIRSIRDAVSARGGFRFPHEVVFRFAGLGKCFYVKADECGYVDIESGAIGSDERNPEYSSV